MIACGAGVGLLNGTILIAGRVMNPFIVTLGMLSIVRGAALVISDAQTATGMPEAVQTMGTGLIGPAAGAGRAGRRASRWSRG